MNKENVVKCYLNKVPEIQEEFSKQCKENLIDHSDGVHVIWSLVIMPCVINLTKDLKENKEVLERTFAFFEEMALSDEEVREILLYSVLENLGDDKELLNTVIPLMGKNTLKYSEQIENFLGR